MIAVQLRLNALGIDVGPVDGVLGQSTTAGVKTFQSQMGMTPTGEITPELIRELRTLVPNVSPDAQPAQEAAPPQPSASESAPEEVALPALPAYEEDFQEGLDAFNSGDYATALREWRPLSGQGYAKAQYKLGIMYQYARGVALDYAKAVRLYRLAAEQGYAKAQYNLGVLDYSLSNRFDHYRFTAADETGACSSGGGWTNTLTNQLTDAFHSCAASHSSGEDSDFLNCMQAKGWSARDCYY